MWPNPQFPADLISFTEEIHNGNLHFVCSVTLNVILYLFGHVLKIAIFVLIWKTINSDSNCLIDLASRMEIPKCSHFLRQKVKKEYLKLSIL